VKECDFAGVLHQPPEQRAFHQFNGLFALADIGETAEVAGETDVGTPCAVTLLICICGENRTEIKSREKI
jgi:hypothetical protein